MNRSPLPCHAHLIDDDAIDVDACVVLAWQRKDSDSGPSGFGKETFLKYLSDATISNAEHHIDTCSESRP